MKQSLSSNATSNRHFVLLAPSGVTSLRDKFRRVEADGVRRQDLLADMQRLRGRVYLRDGAISEDDLTDGRHIQSIDEQSWHLLVLDSAGRVVGCTRYLQHHSSTHFSELCIKSAALADCKTWSGHFRSAVESELEVARRSNFSYVEVGGWAVDERLRGSSDALKSVLFTYAWSQTVGGCLGLVMATQRNSSAAILRRIGGRPLQWDGVELPPYYDPKYNCDMEVLRFDSRLTSPKYRVAIAEIRSQIPMMQVIHGGSFSHAWHSLVRRMRIPVPEFMPGAMLGGAAEGIAPTA